VGQFSVGKVGHFSVGILKEFPSDKDILGDAYE